MNPVIYKPNPKFAFTDVQLTKPLTEGGNNHLIKYVIKDIEQPFYIQSPRCFTKKGIQKVGKKYYCDLLFSASTHEEFVTWVENLEKYSQECIFQNREKWFETSLEMEDIDNFFTSSFKIFKSGKYYSLHTQIVGEEDGQCNLYIYNSQKSKIKIEDVKEMTPVIVILEIVGIKCVARGFHILWEMKQMMVVSHEESFQNCLITTATPTPIDAAMGNATMGNATMEEEEDKEEDNDSSQEMAQKSKEKDDSQFPPLLFPPPVPPSSPEVEEVVEEINPPPPIELNTNNLSMGELEEVDIFMDNDNYRLDTISSKEKQMYLQQFEKLIRKIKEAQENTKQWIEEAKHIKHEFLKDEKLMDELENIEILSVNFNK